MNSKIIPVLCLFALLSLQNFAGIHLAGFSRVMSSTAKTGPINPKNGQYANYSFLVYSYNGTLISSGYINVTYKSPTVPMQGCINATMDSWMNPFPLSTSSWEAVNTSDRRIVEHSSNIWSGIGYYQLWIPLLVAVGDDIAWWITPDANATVMDAQMLSLPNRTIDCWRVECVAVGVSPDPKELNETAWFDKLTGHCARYIINNTDGYYDLSILETNIIAGKRVHNLNTGLNYTAIQEATDAAETLNGHTIFVEEGLYYENLIVNKTLSLIGENEEATIIDGNENGTVVLVLANNTLVTGFTIRGSGDKIVDGEHAIRCGIMVGGYETPFKSALIVNNSIKNNYFGVLLWYSFNSQLINNNLENNTYGVTLDSIFHSEIVDNNVSNSSIGISAQGALQSSISRNNITFNNIAGLRMQDSYFNTINENILENNGYGIDLSGSDSNGITGNIMTSNDNGIFLGRSNSNTLIGNNAANSFYGMRIRSSSNNTLRNNSMAQNYWNFAIDADYLSETIQDIDTSNTVGGKPIVYWINEHDKQVTTDAGFVAAINCSGITVKNVNLTRNNFGVLFWSTCNSTIENANISDNWVGVGLILSNHTKLNNCVVANNSEEGIVSMGDDNNITGNVIKSNGRTALWLYSSNRNIINNNTISNNGESSIGLESSCNNTITNNEILSNVGGISLYSFSGNNTIHDNTVFDSRETGIQLTFHSESNLIYHNNFINNTRQAYPESTNVWDDGYPSGGNYWSDYTGVDLYSSSEQNQSGSDGIGDIPYTIDRYPLVGMFSDFNATSEYRVQTICNSSMSGFTSNGTSVSFNVTGEEGTAGFCRICIPTALMNATYRVFVNGTEVQCNLLPCSNSTHSYLYFTYSHSTKEIVIIPELTSLIILPLFMIATLIIVTIFSKKRIDITQRAHTHSLHVRVWCV